MDGVPTAMWWGPGGQGWGWTGSPWPCDGVPKAPRGPHGLVMGSWWARMDRDTTAAVPATQVSPRPRRCPYGRDHAGVPMAIWRSQES